MNTNSAKTVYFAVAAWLTMTLLGGNLFAQSVSGRIFSSDDNEALTFVTVAISGTSTGTISDIDGRFNLAVPTGYQGTITFQHVGFVRKQLTVAEINQSPIIFLEKEVTELEELIFEAGENPANILMRQVIANRKKHDPARFPQYSYKSYTKDVYHLDADTKTADSLAILMKEQSEDYSTDESDTIAKADTKFFKVDSSFNTRHLYVAESVSETKFIEPGLKNETILATQISGLRGGLFAAFSGLYQPFGFYNDVLDIFDKDYINPINPSGLSQYDFYIEDTTFFETDTVFVVSYAPKKGKKFDGLEGFLWVHAKEYALTNVTAKSQVANSKIDVSIQQRYAKVKGQWFPVQLNTDIIFKEFKFYGRNLVLENRRYLSDINLETNYSKKDFSDVGIALNRVDKKQQEQILNANRAVPLDSMELNTFVAMDSMYKSLRVIEGVAEAVLTMRLKMGMVDLRIDDLFGINNYEKFRLGAGLETNNNFSERLKLGGYGGYGFADEEWKYGTNVRWNFDKRTDTWLLFTYQNDLREVGVQRFFEGKISSIEDLIRSFQGSLFDRHETYKLSLNRRIAPFLYAQTSVSTSDQKPTYDYQYNNTDYTNTYYHINEVSLSFRYVKNEQYLDLYGRKVLYDYDFPVFNFKYSHANSGWLGGDFNYHRVDMSAEYKKKYVLGKSEFLVRAAYVSGDVPYGHMITGLGNASSSLSVPEYFQTMDIYEFLSDQQVALFFNHNFGNFLISNRVMKPELIVYHNSGIGRLTHPERHQGVAFKTMEEGYFESGIGIKKLIRLNYFDVGYMGFGFDAVYRYGAYAYESTRDNLFFKLNMKINL
ncbi:DUF5686 and carboxypeptidase regulatory-like domain-containing protein [Reichenbachiella carrageenanivorans]|uniref:DUF5686 and carboxypeptidase regulatory-like domain-containing protein n=1 Tax=Reichenbachiella carrageenanivorans TaxID=2979869 RepID=A0ABY6D006_9BACT|nr:DUF5686 and carboxypeptidase-like regulatory domain-containing protein [Reichenbachiella carrageenanivorans]UXX79024.1 DUF5686 and carboxypeptidase regulatory-like domain-containing protein [Reichenbachiella carrageenanivorans]